MDGGLDGDAVPCWRVWRLAATVNTHAKLIMRQKGTCTHALSFQLGLRETLTLLSAGTKSTRRRDELCNVSLHWLHSAISQTLLYLPDITKLKKQTYSGAANKSG